MGTSAARPDPQPKEGEEGKKERKEKKKSSSDGLEEEALAEWGPLGNVKAFTIASLEVAKPTGFLKNGARKRCGAHAAGFSSLYRRCICT